MTSSSCNAMGVIAGRFLLALIFVMSGIGKLKDFDGTAALIAGRGLPLPTLLTAATIVLEIVAGVMVVFGWRLRWSAGALMLFTLVAGALFHNFWQSAPADAHMQMIHFMKNLAIAGGLLFVACSGAEQRAK